MLTESEIAELEAEYDNREIVHYPIRSRSHRGKTFTTTGRTFRIHVTDGRIYINEVYDGHVGCSIE